MSALFAPGDICVVCKPNVEPRRAEVRGVDDNDRVLVHYPSHDARLDEYVESIFVVRGAPAPPTNGSRQSKGVIQESDSEDCEDNYSDDDADYDISESTSDDVRAKKQQDKNFEKVVFGDWLIRTWYFSPYPVVLPPDESGVRTEVSSLPKRGAENNVLWVCHRCFKYMGKSCYEQHKIECTLKDPPGPEVYRKDNVSLFEVDGANDKVYCQNLSLFCKFFIDVKTLYFDCEGFLFYILTENTATGREIVGYFSKEKISFDQNNLACILTLPPHQKKGYGMLMIEFSYFLSQKAGKIGGPERPLSDLGLLSYLSYWVRRLIWFFRDQLVIVPLIDNTGIQVSVGEPMDISAMSVKLNSFDEDVPEEKVLRSTTFHHYLDADGGFRIEAEYTTTLKDISEATGLTTGDAAFALNEIGLLEDKIQTGDTETCVVVTWRKLMALADRRKIRKSIFDPDCVANI